MDAVLRNVIRRLEKEWGVRPLCILAYQDAKDEHWQVFHPEHLDEKPAFAVYQDGTTYEHIKK